MTKLDHKGHTERDCAEQGHADWHILLLDHFPLRRAAFRSFLENGARAQGRNCTVLEGNPGDAVPAVPDVSAVLLDLGGTPGQRAEMPALLRALQADRRPVAIVADHSDAEDVAACLAAGARGFIATHMSPQETIHALAFMIGGGVFFPPEALLHRAAAVPDPQPILAQADPVDESTFTLRQREVLVQLRRGYSNKLIGRELQMCESTVKVHVRQIMRKLGVTNRTQAALQALTTPASSLTEPVADAALATLLPVAEMSGSEAALPLRV